MRGLDCPALHLVTHRDELLVACVGRSLTALGYLSPIGPMLGVPAFLVAAQIAFRDVGEQPCAGTLCVAFDRPAIETLAGAMLARPEGQAIAEADAADAARELVNVACGDLLPPLFAQRDAVVLALPELTAVPTVLRRPWIGLRCDSGNIAIRLSVD